MVKTDEPILILCPSRKISGTVRSAEIAAGEFPHADIRIIDTHTIGSALGSIVRKAVAWRNEGASADEIEKRIAKLSERSRTYFLVDTLEYLQKGDVLEPPRQSSVECCKSNRSFASETAKSMHLQPSVP
jgi:DegV family protein with EDD domain